MTRALVVVLISVFCALGTSGDMSKAGDFGVLKDGVSTEIALLSDTLLTEPRQWPQSTQPLHLLPPLPLQQLAQGCPADAPVDCGSFCYPAGYSCETGCPIGHVNYDGLCCPAGDSYCGEFCCSAGYSCVTECKCQHGQGVCPAGGCCPSNTPHTCAESSRCYETAQGAVDGGCTWSSVEVCSIAQ